jgi:tetratricopeptide (TPR) repeat protein
MNSKFCRSSIVLLIFAFVTVCQAGNDQWVEVRSKNFTVITDAGQKRGGDVLLRFEQMRSAFAYLFQKIRVNTPVPLEIVAFRNSKELKAVSPLWKGKPVELAGLFQQGEGRNFIALDLSAENGWAVVFHEYAHLLMNSNLPPTPLWLDEGYAEYFSTLTVSGKNLEFGTLPEGRAQVLLQNSWMKSAALFSVQHNSREYNEGDRRNIFYAQSWLTVHYMMNQKKLKELAVYLELTDKQHVPIPDAFKQAFGMTLDQFDRTLYNYFHGSMVYFRAPAPADIDKGPYQSRVLTAAEKDATIADFKFHTIDHNAEGIAEFKKVLEEDPNNEVANRGLGYACLRQRDFEQAAGYLKRASASGSRDPRIHFFNAMVLSHSTSGGMININPDEADAVKAELLKAVELDPGYADAYNLLSVTESVKGNPKEAIHYAEKAVQLNPRNDYYLMNLANYYLRDEEFDKATALLSTLKNSSNSLVAMSAQQNLEQLQRMKEFKAQGGTVIIQPNTAVRSSEDGERVESVQPPKVDNSHPVGFLKGTLLSVDCNLEPAAMLEVKSGTKIWHFRAEDRSKLVLIGADEFSCGWKNKPVAVNFREIGPQAGDLISLELQ